MTLLRFNAAARHILVEGGERIHGGEKFEVDEERALELLTNPHVDIVEVAPDAVESAGAEAPTDAVETPGDGETPTETVEADAASAENVATETDTQREADDGGAPSIEGGTL